MIRTLKGNVILAMLFTAFFITVNSSPAPGADDKNLFIIKTNIQTDFNEVQVADLKGYFAEEGIKIEYVGIVEGLSSYQMLAQGHIDFVSGHPDGVAKARLAGILVKGVVPGMVDHPDYPHIRYIVKGDSPIKTLDDVAGKKVGMTDYASCIDGYLKYYLAGKGIKKEPEWVVLPAIAQSEQAMIQGLVDVTTSHPPFGSIALAAGGRQIATSWDIFHSAAAGLSTRNFSEDFINAHPKELKGFAKAMYRARKWINNNMDEAVPLVSAALGIDPETASAEKDGRYYSDDREIKKEHIELWFKLSETLGYWNHGDLQPEDVYTNEFAPGKEEEIS
jgi:ABC-type nitrate/sulfonate/bicarbonate transport system substrate-binding protein